MKRQYFLVIDTETTLDHTVLDFAAVVCDRRGKIYHSCAVVVKDVELSTLYHNKDSGFFNSANLERRISKYNDMIADGRRMVASVAAINRWLDKCLEKYNPMLTAYNLTFDYGKCNNTGIILDKFTNRFCLWNAASSIICHRKPYLRYVLQNHLFNCPTPKGNMSFRTDAEAVAGFVTGALIDEPHTALEDITGFEIPILLKVIATKDWQSKICNYAWNNFQVKDHYHA